MKHRVEGKHRGKFWWENPVEFEERDYMRFGYVTLGTVRAGKHSGVEHPGCAEGRDRFLRECVNFLGINP